MRFTILFVLLACCAAFVWADEEKTVSETRAISGVQALHLSGSGNVFLTQGNEESLRIDAPAKLLPMITTVVKKGTLTISYKLGKDLLLPPKGVDYYLTVKSLAKISVAGTGAVTCDTLQAKALNVSVSGAGNVTLTVATQMLECDINGAGTFTLAGTTDKQKLSILGKGDYLAAQLQSKECTVHFSGSGKAEVCASDKLTVKILGAGTVSYLGDPVVTQDVYGSGTVQRLEAK